MKKNLLWGAAAALVLSFSSCDDPSLITQMVQEGLLGSAEITISGQNGYYDNNETVNFSCAIMDSIQQVVIEEENFDTNYVSTLSLFANYDLQKSELTFPFMGFQFTDTAAGTYTFSKVLTADRLRNFNFDTIADIVFNTSGFNVLLIAITDTSWYVSDGGSLIITEYPATGHNMKGRFENVDAYYFTKTDVERLEEHLDDANLDQLLNTYFHHAAISGEFTSRRYPTLIKKIIDEAYKNRGLWENEIPE